MYDTRQSLKQAEWSFREGEAPIKEQLWTSSKTFTWELKQASADRTTFVVKDGVELCPMPVIHLSLGRIPIRVAVPAITYQDFNVP